MEAGTRPKMYFDSETRRIRRASHKITTLCKFEANSDKFTEGMLNALEELRK